MPYTGRFAPSPTGPLHFGSLVAAVASYLQARRADGRWLLRIEDIDPPRQQAGVAERIVATLASYGFAWDGPVLYQGGNRQRHLQVASALRRQLLAYPCRCSRRDLADAPQGPLGAIYPGTCRNGCDGDEYALRLLTDNSAITCHDLLQGDLTQRLESQSGDFVILRRDGLIAYHLAVVVDDADQQVTEVVRGIDLFDSTPRQIYLQRLLGYPTPGYLHIPVVENSAGQKLSKLTGATAVPDGEPRPALLEALKALHMRPPADLGASSLDDIWSWAIRHWEPARLRGQKRIVGRSDPLAGR